MHRSNKPLQAHTLKSGLLQLTHLMTACLKVVSPSVLSVLRIVNLCTAEGVECVVWYEDVSNGGGESCLQIKIYSGDESCSYNETGTITHWAGGGGDIWRQSAGHAPYNLLGFELSAELLGWAEVNHNIASHFLALRQHAALLSFQKGNFRVKKHAHTVTHSFEEVTLDRKMVYRYPARGLFY